MPEQLILYDLPKKGRCACWSMNTWKARLVLNYKSIPYQTEWTDYPAITPKFQSYGIPPNPPSLNPHAEYSVPAIQLPDGRFVMDSLKIAEELEKLYPAPPLALDTSSISRTQAAVVTVFWPLAATALTDAVDHIIADELRDWFLDSRCEMLGTPREELGSMDKQAAWEKAQPGLQQLRDILAEDERGPFVKGAEPGFADFVMAGFWRFIDVLDSDPFGRVIGFDPSFAQHYDACRKWMIRDD